MNINLIAACCIAGSTFTLALADQTGGNPKTAPRQASSAMVPSAPKPAQPAARLNPRPTPTTLALGGGDDCSTADVISGTGGFAFDTTLATTSAQQSGVCPATANFDVWFSWTAPSSGACTYSLCGGTAAQDSVIAVYAGSGCPSGPALACNDDSCGLESALSFPVVAGSNYMLQLGGYSSSVNIGVGTFTLNVAGAIANDDCASATVVAGSGSFPFSNLGATTGTQGQGLSCGGGTCNLDVWYSWTAPMTGYAEFSLCGGAGFDSLIAAYAGSGCPSGAALACSDDACGVQSRISFPVTGGANYMLQIGAYSTGSGAGTFTLNVAPPPPPCGPYDDGTTENMLAWGAGGDIVWLSRFGSVGGSSIVTSVDVAWGSAMFPSYSPGDGTPTEVFIWTDGVSQDGDPSDATLVLTIPTLVASVDTDTYVNIPVAPMTLNGIFFVGTHLTHLPGQFVAPMDQTAHPYSGVSWFFGDNTPGALANYANPGANIQPPSSFDAAGYMAQVLVRVSCGSGPATYSCDPNTAGVLACPCSNPAVGSGRGCDNSSATGGASILGAGSNSLLSPTLYFTTAGEKPTATTILVQGTAEVPAGVAFGQGVRCVGGVLSRMYVKSAVGGSIVAPGAGDADIPARSMSLGDTITAGQDRWYMAYYRDPNVLGGCNVLATYNATNTAKVTWLP